MDCRTARSLMEKRADGLLPPEAGAELDAHLSACPECSAELSRELAVGRLLKSHAAARAASVQGGLDAMRTRVRAGIAEAEAPRRRFRRWLWAALPAGALVLVVFALLFYPTGLDRSPFNPRTFEVSVEDVESDVAVVTQLDMGEDKPRVIWIIEDVES